VSHKALDRQSQWTMWHSKALARERYSTQSSSGLQGSPMDTQVCHSSKQHMIPRTKITAIRRAACSGRVQYKCGAGRDPGFTSFLFHFLPFSDVLLSAVSGLLLLQYVILCNTRVRGRDGMSTPQNGVAAYSQSHVFARVVSLCLPCSFRVP